MPITFKSSERIKSRRQADLLFKGRESHVLSVFPVRLVYMETEQLEGKSQLQVMMSVSKRHFKGAVKRNRVKRQLRESYRLNKHLLQNTIKGRAYSMAFLWQCGELLNSKRVCECVEKLLCRMAEKINYDEGRM